MKMIYLILLISLFGCAGPTKIGDEKFKEGDLVGAIKAYDDASAQNLTKREHRTVNAARAKVYEEKIKLAFAASMNLSADEKRAALNEIYVEAKNETSAEDLFSKIEKESLLVSMPEIEAIHALIQSRRVDAALSKMQQLFSAIISSDAAVSELVSLRLHAAAVLNAMAEIEKSSEAKLLLRAVAARCDQSEFPAKKYADPHFTLQSQINHLNFKVPGEGVVVDMDGSMKMESSTETLSETYIFTVYEEKTFLRKVCKSGIVGYKKVSVPHIQHVVSFNGGRESYVKSTSYRTVSVPEYGSICRSVPVTENVPIDKQGTRTFRQRKISLRTQGRMSVRFDKGTQALPFDITLEDEVRESPYTLDRSLVKFFEDEVQQRERLEEEVKKKIYDLTKLKLRILYQSDALSEAAQTSDFVLKRNAYARAVLYGAKVNTRLADLNFSVGQEIRWLEPFDVPFFDYSVVKFNRFYGQAAQRFEFGFDFLKFSIGSRYVQMNDLSVQPERRAFGVELELKMPFFSLMTLDRYDPFGWVFYDEYSLSFTLGARTSEAYQYPIINRDAEEDGFYSSWDVYAQALVGYRVEGLGLLVGFRPRAMIHEVGDAEAASTGAPLIARLELGLFPRNPIVVQAWGFSPFGDQNAKGLELQIAFSEEWNLAGKFMFLDASTRVGGIKDNDSVDLERRPGFVAGFSFEYLPRFIE